MRHFLSIFSLVSLFAEGLNAPSDLPWWCRRILTGTQLVCGVNIIDHRIKFEQAMTSSAARLFTGLDVIFRYADWTAHPYQTPGHQYDHMMRLPTRFTDSSVMACSPCPLNTWQMVTASMLTQWLVATTSFCVST